MSRNIVITIGREFGSGGREIGQKVAKTLGISFYDKNLIEIAAQKSGINSDLLYQADEKASNPFFSASSMPANVKSSFPSDTSIKAS